MARYKTCAVVRLDTSFPEVSKSSLHFGKEMYPEHALVFGMLSNQRLATHKFGECNHSVNLDLSHKNVNHIKL